MLAFEIIVTQSIDNVIHIAMIVGLFISSKKTYTSIISDIFVLFSLLYFKAISINLCTGSITNIVHEW